jgi:hypothetical protein
MLYTSVGRINPTDTRYTARRDAAWERDLDLGRKIQHVTALVQRTVDARV